MTSDTLTRQDKYLSYTVRIVLKTAVAKTPALSNKIFIQIIDYLSSGRISEYLR